MAKLPEFLRPAGEDGVRLSADELNKVQEMRARPAKEEAKQSGISPLTHGARGS